MMTISKNFKGFSLVEMAVVVVLIGVLMTFGIKLASSFQDRAAYSSTREKQSKIQDSLRAYLAQNGRLPCPAIVSSPPQGLEVPAVPNGICDANPGIIPYATLGLPRDSVIDGWNHLFIYEVANIANCGGVGTWVTTSNFVAAPFRTYHDGENGCITITDDQNGDGVLELPNRTVVAVVVSNGANGEGGYSQNGVLSQLNEADTTNSREKDNILSHSGKTPYVYHTEPITLTGFDDIIFEISANDLLAPLKQDGSIKSINQVARDYFNLTVSVNPTTCVLTYPAAATPNPPLPSANQSPVVLSINFNGVNFTHTMVGADYGCALGFNYP